MRYAKLTDECILAEAKRIGAVFLYRGYWQFYEPNLLEFARNIINEDEKIERDAQEAINSGHHDEVPSLRSTALKLSIAAARISDRLNCANKNGE